MKLSARILALCLAFALLFTCAVAEEIASEATEIPDMPVVTINGAEHSSAYIIELAQMLYEYGYTTTADDYYATLQYLINASAEESKIHELGFDQFTEEENSEFLAEAESEMETLIQEWMAYYQTSEEPTEEETATLRTSIEEYFQSMGYTVDALLADLQYSASFDKLIAYMEENYELSVTDEEIRTYFEEAAELDRQTYENDVYTYEIYTTYYGYESWWMPEGYRGIIQILLEVDETLLNEYLTKLAAYEKSLVDETDSEEAAAETDATAEPVVTLEEVNAARDAALASRQDTIDEIYARLENGEAFVDLIPEYNTDPGMDDEQTLQEGYKVHRESMMDEAFLDAVFSDKMQQPGDVSDPSVGSYGIYIAYYLRDIPSGIVELTDELYSEIESILKNEKLSALYNELVEEWAADIEVIYNEENLLAVTGLTLENGKLAEPVADDEEVEEQE